MKPVMPMKPVMQTFHRWLMQQRGRPGPVGDLARDAHDDYDWPKTAQTFARFSSYLTDCDAIEGAHRALERAWREYRALEEQHRIFVDTSRSMRTAARALYWDRCRTERRAAVYIYPGQKWSSISWNADPSYPFMQRRDENEKLVKELFDMIEDNWQRTWQKGASVSGGWHDGHAVGCPSHLAPVVAMKIASFLDQNIELIEGSIL